jgi:hypothetical protein
MATDEEMAKLAASLRYSTPLKTFQVKISTYTPPLDVTLAGLTKRSPRR